MTPHRAKNKTASSSLTVSKRFVTNPLKHLYSAVVRKYKSKWTMLPILSASVKL